jgi:hypothetical protein
VNTSTCQEGEPPMPQGENPYTHTCLDLALCTSSSDCSPVSFDEQQVKGPPESHEPLWEVITHEEGVMIWSQVRQKCGQPWDSLLVNGIWSGIIVWDEVGFGLSQGS